MNVFHSFTRRSLQEKRSRTLVTLIGIILSTALFTAVIEGAYSGIQYLVRTEEARGGRYHGYYYNLTEEEFSRAQAVEGQSESASWQQVGWAEIGSQNEDKPYLLINSISANFTDLVAVHLISGRLPEADGELLLPAHLATNGNVTLQPGDTLRLAVGERVSGNSVLDARTPYLSGAQERIVHSTERTYTIVGFYERFDFDIEDYSCPGYTALTVGSAEGTYNLFFRLHQPRRFYDFMKQNAVCEQWRAHSDLLRYVGSLRDGGLVQMLSGFTGVLIFLIAFGSISLIYNSFSISISDRTRQFGILKSIGATRRQIRSTVLYEAALLSLIAIPIGLLVGCTGIGITLWCLRDSFAFLTGSDLNVQMQLALSPMGLSLAVACCLITTFISAWIPARKAIRLSPIDSIRQTTDVRLRRRDVRVSWLTKKLFGFEGMLAAKNFGRNRKQYRATILSLFLSVTLFISAASFCAYLTSTVTGMASAGSDNGADIVYSLGQLDGVPSDVVMDALQVEGVQASAYTDRAYVMLALDRSALTDEYLNHVDTLRGELTMKPEIWTAVCFIDDDSFRALCAANQLDAEDYFDEAHPQAIALNRVTDSFILPGTDRLRWTSFEILNADALPVDGVQERFRQIDGYWFYEKTTDSKGNERYLYYPDEADGVQLNEDDALRLSADDVLEIVPFSIGAAVADRTFCLPGETSFAIVYPYSMKAAVGTADFREELEPQILFDVDEHSSVFERMLPVLVENGWWTQGLYDMAEAYEQDRMLFTVINVFAYGFILLISLIAMANVFNTISTSIALRRREFAMLKSVGLTNRSFGRMMNYECMIYGIRSLLWGLPAAFALSYVIFRITDISYETSFYVPPYSVAIAVGSVFAVVFATMLYATHRIRRDNPIDALKDENL